MVGAQDRRWRRGLAVVQKLVLLASAATRTIMVPEAGMGLAAVVQSLRFAGPSEAAKAGSSCPDGVRSGAG